MSVTSISALMLLAAITIITGQPWLIPPMAASMALIVGAPHLALSQPRNVIGGQTVSATVGIGLSMFGDSLWIAALAGGLAFTVMALLRVDHSPAAATAMVGVTTATAWTGFILLAAIAAVVLVLIGYLGNKIKGTAYPDYFW